MTVRLAPQQSMLWSVLTAQVRLKPALTELTSPKQRESSPVPGRVEALHNQRLPRGRGDIDDLAVTPPRAWVIDTKDSSGVVMIHKPWFGTPRLPIHGRDRTKLILGLERQIDAVRTALGGAGHEAIAVQCALRFTKADLPLLKKQTFRGH